MRRKLWSTVLGTALLAAALLGLTGCAPAGDGEGITLRVVCRSPEVYQLFYTLYLDGEPYSQGGWGDLDGGPLTAHSDLTAVFPRDFFPEGELPRLSLDFSPYGKGDCRELATTQPVEIPAVFGETCTILFSGDREGGFAAALQE